MGRQAGRPAGSRQAGRKGNEIFAIDNFNSVYSKA